MNANSAEHPDLFWALKGGMANFGIVARFDLSTVPIRDIWYSMSTYAITEVPEILLAFEQWQLRSADPKSSIYPPPGGTRLLYHHIGLFIALHQSSTTMLQCILWDRYHGVFDSSYQWHGGLVDASTCKTVPTHSNEIGFTFPVDDYRLTAQA